MATIYKPGNSRNYSIKFYFNGKQYHRSLKVKNKRDAERLKSEIEMAIAQGAFNPEQLVSGVRKETLLFDFLNDYLQYLDSRRNKYSPRTVECYERSVVKLRQIIGNIPLKSVNVKLIETKILPYLESQFKPATVKHNIVNFRQIFSFTVKWELLPKNPFSGLAPKLSREMPVFFKESEIRKIINYFNRPDGVPWQQLYFLLMLNTGNRKTELFNLTWSNNIFLDEQVIKFHGKGNNERIVPLNDFAIHLLRSADRRLGEERLFWEVKSTSTIDSAWQYARTKIGLRYKIHHFRSNFASWFIMNGGNPIALMKIMGWEDWQTVKVYMGLSRDFIKSHRNVVEF
ncbi:MAG: tyrosine-type recombinase/integrase [Calditrichaeota bacterium]|nr:tyrosine-type recombinase/integrase [Calditrichota bacterium]